MTEETKNFSGERADDEEGNEFQQQLPLAASRWKRMTVMKSINPNPRTPHRSTLCAFLASLLLQRETFPHAVEAKTLREKLKKRKQILNCLLRLRRLALLRL